ncbi:MAG: hypothetical protein GXW96_05755 [Christensenellaceae bacterium]|nr:hypothetical protein [Christensenellaceae bacterium]
MKIFFTIIEIAAFGSAIALAAARFFRRDDGGSAAPVRLGAKTTALLFGAALVSRAVLLLLCWGGTHLSGFSRPLAETWSRWDALQYLRIATQGYYDAADGWIRIVFFPLYPAAVRLLNIVIGHEHIAALAVSWLCLSGACVFLYKLALLDADAAAARRAVRFLLLFPVAVFLGAPFSESMFLLLSLACVYHARTGRFVAACALGGLAALTRSVGVLLAVPVLLEMLGAYGLTPGGWKRRGADAVRQFFYRAPALLLIPLGTAAYLVMNHALTGDALLFLRMQSEKWSQSFGSYSNTLDVTWSTLTGGDYILRDKLLLWGSQLVVLLAGALALPAMARKLRVSYSLFAIVYVYVVFAPTWLLSGFRYYMGLWVLYPALAFAVRRKWLDTALTVLFALLAPVYAYAFSMGWLVF